MYFSFATCLSLVVLVSIGSFSAPIARLARAVSNEGLFNKALGLAGVTDPNKFAAELANALSGDPRICDPVRQVVQALVSGESDTSGVTTIGDRAVVGAKKLLGKQNDGDAGTISALNQLSTGTYPANVKKALQDAFSNPPKTLASLQTYKYLVDTQAALQDLSTTVSRIGGNSSIVTAVGQIEPALQQVEAVIDKIGADFSVQNVLNQGGDIQNILNLLNTSGANVTTLQGLNKALQTAITQQTQVAQTAMKNLQSSAQNAAQLANEPNVIPADVFATPGPGTCQ